MIQFAHPWLMSLLILPLAVYFLVPGFNEQRPSLRVPFLGRLKRLSGADKQSNQDHAPRGWIQWLLLCLVWAALVLAVSRPRFLEEPLVLDLPMRDLLVALDLSGSMETEDFTDSAGNPTDRLTAAKGVIADFLGQREGDRVGLIFFGTSAFVQAPFTADLDVVAELLDEAQVRMLGPRTAFGDAIGQSIPLFERSETREKVLIVLTDGNDTASLIPPARAAEIAADQDVRIFPVAMGNPEAAGEQALDEETLEQVARTTGGQYFHADDRETLAAVYEELDRLNPRQVESISYRPEHDLFQWPLGFALVLALMFHSWNGWAAWRRAY